MLDEQHSLMMAQSDLFTLQSSVPGQIADVVVSNYTNVPAWGQLILAEVDSHGSHIEYL